MRTPLFLQSRWIETPLFCVESFLREKKTHTHTLLYCWQKKFLMLPSEKNKEFCFILWRVRINWFALHFYGLLRLMPCHFFSLQPFTHNPFKLWYQSFASPDSLRLNIKKTLKTLLKCYLKRFSEESIAYHKYWSMNMAWSWHKRITIWHFA